MLLLIEYRVVHNWQYCENTERSSDRTSYIVFQGYVWVFSMISSADLADVSVVVISFHILCSTYWSALFTATLMLASQRWYNDFSAFL